MAALLDAIVPALDRATALSAINVERASGELDVPALHYAFTINEPIKFVTGFH